MQLKYSLFLRRLGAIIYDSLLVLALFIIGTALLLFFTKGEIISPNHPSHLGYQLFLCSLWFGFLLWFWTHGGQTAGMSAWRLRLKTISNAKTDQSDFKNREFKNINFKTAVIRLLLAIISNSLAGLGLCWALWDKKGLTLYDRLSNTELILIIQND